MNGNGRGLTGGTGDVNPQIMLVANADIAATAVTIQTPIPIQRLSDRNGRAQVLEILRVYFDVGAANLFVHSTGANSYAAMYLTTRSFGTSEVTSDNYNGQLIAKAHVHACAVATAANVIATGPTFPIVVDLTDNMGHGLLVGTDSLFFQTIQTNAASPLSGNVTCRILYRWKNVSITEYIGIVQSQQA